MVSREKSKPKVPMADGPPVPWPFPWDRTLSQAVSTSAQQRRRHIAHSKAGDAGKETKKIAAAALAEFGEKLPQIQSSELYLIQALAEVTLNGKKVLAVIYPPEFLFILDVGLESLVGVSVNWHEVGHGDPKFPDFSAVALRSVPARNNNDLIFPQVAGSLLVGIKEGTSDGDVKAGLSGQGLRQIEVFDFFATARCAPFAERSIAQALEETLSFVKYAEPDRIQRLVDFSPGWAATRLV